MVKQRVFMSKYTYEKLYLLKTYFWIFSDRKSIDAAKQLRYAEHYYKYSHKKLGWNSENCSNGYNIKKTKKKTYIQWSNHCIRLKALITYIWYIDNIYKLYVTCFYIEFASRQIRTPYQIFDKIFVLFSIFVC